MHDTTTTIPPDVARELHYLRDRVAYADRVIAAVRRATRPDATDDDMRHLVYMEAAHCDFVRLRPDPGATRALRQVDASQRRARMRAAGEGVGR